MSSEENRALIRTRSFYVLPDSDPADFIDCPNCLSSYPIICRGLRCSSSLGPVFYDRDGCCVHAQYCSDFCVKNTLGSTYSLCKNCRDLFFSPTPSLQLCIRCDPVGHRFAVQYISGLS